MRSIIRLVAAGALSLPLVLGAAGIASADVEFDQNAASATADGATVYDLASGADAHGNSYFVQVFEAAGPYGAGSYLQAAWTYHGDAGYFEDYAFSGHEGAWTGDTSAHANSHHGHDGADDDD
ncbi:hypothetical protein ACIGNX_24900 [Actinosynnema sp. NPDC053489]|uniref:hypothetical protein n=1 Tax=Actinosynnema sp. NPDC053489 TaxID=3363916 RepID=UPI0037CACDDE